MKKAFISPKHLKALRDRKGWSRSKLSDLSGVTERSIASYETATEETVSLTQNNFKKLARALRERPEVLSGKKDLPSETRETNINITLHPQTRLNYDLLEKRYGITMEEALNAAPLLIVEAAEKSLIAFKERIDRDEKQIGEAYHLLRLLGKESEFDPNTVLPQLSDEDVDVRQTLSEMRDSVFTKDIFGSQFPWIFDLDDPGTEANPFAKYLSELSSSLPNTYLEEDEFLEFLTAFPGTRVPKLHVCMDILREITLGSWEAIQALTSGIVSIHEIPEDLWGAHSASDRVKWLEEKFNAASETDDE